MKFKRIIILIIVLCSVSLYSQNKNELISIDVTDTSFENVLLLLESKSDSKFYFDPNWGNLKKKISVKAENEKIENILNDIFKESNFNFYQLENKIIITQNNYIFDDLNSNLIEIENKENLPLEKPIFYQDSDTASVKQNTKETTKLVIIGKQSVEGNKTFYTLEGYVLDAKTKLPIVNAIIKSNNTSAYTITDIDGFYKIKLPTGVNNIEISPISHEKIYQKIIIKKNGKLNFETFEKVINLNEVVLEAKSNKIVKEVISGVTSFDIEKVKDIPLVLGERDIIKVATTLPGIKTTGEGSAGFNVRGGKEDQNLILLDNATVYNPSHFFGFFTAISPYTVKNVDIYKGSIPAEYGGRLSSVFDIQTKEGDFEKIKGEGGIGPVTSNLTLSTPIIKEKSSLLVGGRATYSDWILKSLKNDELKNSKASFFDVFMKYKHKINANNTLETSVYYSKDAYNLTSDSLFSYSNRIASLNWKHFFSDKHIGDVSISNSEYKFNIDYDSNNLKSFDFGFKVNETKLILKGRFEYKDKHKITYGLNSTLYNIQPGSLNPKDQNSQLVYQFIPKERALENALFISDNFEINKKLSLNLGLRYSYFMALGPSSQREYASNQPLSDENVTTTNDYGNNEVVKTYNGLEYRIATRYFLTETMSVKLSYDTNYQYLHKLSTNTTQSPTDTWKLSDLNIKPTFGQQASFGIFKTFKEGLYELSVESYYKKSSNFLDYKVGAELVLNNNIETEVIQGEGKAYGVEFLIKKTKGRLNGWIGYTYSRSLTKLNGSFNEERVNNGLYFPSNSDKPHDFTTILNYKITKRYSFSMNFVYQTGRPITYPVGTYTYGNVDYTLYSDRNKFRIPDYYRMDIGFNVEGNHKLKKLAHSYWNISIYNVLGRNNPYSIYFVTEEGKVKGYQTSIFSIPIPTITYNFKF